MALEILARHGHDLQGRAPKPLTLFQGPDAPRMDVVFTICDGAAPWPAPDRPLGPARPEGPEAESALAFAALALAELDRLALQRGLDQIARTPDRN